MTKGAAVLAIAIALAVGWYAARWLLAEQDELSARGRLERARKVMWGARRVLAGTVAIGAVLITLWFHGKGR